MIREERIEIGRIPALRIYGSEPSQGVVIFYHGWTSTKELQALRGRIFAAYGYDVLIPDAINHGERGPIDYNEPAAYAAFWQTIFRNVEEAAQLIDYAKAWRPGLPLAVTGHSMGGFTALGVLTHYDEFSTAVAMNGSGWWDESERRFRAALNLDKPAGFAGLLASLKAYDPYDHMDKLAGRSLLAINGGADPVVDGAAQTLYMEKLSNQPEVQSEALSFPGLGHFVTTQMMGAAIDWLQKELH